MTLSEAFNPRPHKEVDPAPGRIVAGAILSFQSTTSQGGRHMVCFIRHICKDLSIHDLTRRSTLSRMRSGFPHRSFNPRPHKEVDRKTAEDDEEKINFQSTTSQGGRPSPECDQDFLIGLSIHDLTRRSTRELGLTPSSYRTFNPRPHKEVDLGSDPKRSGIILSIHDLTRRST